MYCYATIGIAVHLTSVTIQDRKYNMPVVVINNDYLPTKSLYAVSYAMILVTTIQSVPRYVRSSDEPMTA